MTAMGTAAAAPKRQRTAWVKAEAWLQLAMSAQRWAAEVADGSIEQWPPDDALRKMVEKYGLTRVEVTRLLTGIAQQCEDRCERLTGPDGLPDD